MKQPRLNKPAFQERQRLLLAEQQARGIPLIQRRSDGEDELEQMKHDLLADPSPGLDEDHGL